MSQGITRRRFLELAAAGAVGAWLQGCGGSSHRSAGANVVFDEATFFTDAERRLAEALAEAIVPEDETVGALGAGAVTYIDRLLAAFDNPVPTIYRGGPFSGRAPYPDAATGEPTAAYPRNAFRDLLPLSRLQEAAWRIELEGSDAVPGGDVNDAVVGAWPGWRRLYREALAALGDPDAFEALDADARLGRFDGLDARFRDAFTAHLAEGMFGAPEYGGNRDGVAWRDYFYDGDSQPLGHTLFDRRTQTLRDRPDQPNQTIDPADPAATEKARGAFAPEVASLLDALVRESGGRRFF